MLFIEVCNFQVGGHFGVVDSLAMPLLVGASYIDIFVKGILPMKRCLILILSPLGAIVSEQRPSSSPAAVWQTSYDVESDTNDQSHNKDWTPMLRMANGVTILMITEASLPVSRKSSALI